MARKCGLKVNFKKTKTMVIEGSMIIDGVNITNLRYADVALTENNLQNIVEKI